MRELTYLNPGTVKDAIKFYENHDNACYIAGGTDVVIEFKDNPEKYKYLISLEGLKNDLNYIKTGENELKIGALTTHRQLQFSKQIEKMLTALSEGAGQVGSAQIRNIGTVGGNICSALPSGDTLSPLLALDASVNLESASGERVVLLEDFFIAPGKTDKEPEEILKEVIVPLPPVLSGSAYIKHGKRKALEIAMVGAAVYLESGEDFHCTKARIALTTSAPKPIRAKKAENALIGENIEEKLLAKAGEMVLEEASPRTSLRGSSEYRKKVLPELVLRAGLKAMDRIKEK